MHTIEKNFKILRTGVDDFDNLRILKKSHKRRKVINAQRIYGRDFFTR